MYPRVKHAWIYTYYDFENFERTTHVHKFLYKKDVNNHVPHDFYEIITFLNKYLFHIQHITKMHAIIQWLNVI